MCLNLTSIRKVEGPVVAYKVFQMTPILRLAWGQYRGSFLYGWLWKGRKFVDPKEGEVFYYFYNYSLLGEEEKEKILSYPKGFHAWLCRSDAIELAACVDGNSQVWEVELSGPEGVAEDGIQVCGSRMQLLRRVK